MPRYTAALLTLATLSATTLIAQSPDPAAGPASTGTYTQSQPAPIQHDYARGPRGPRRDLSGITTQQPVQGVYVRIGAGAQLTTVSTAADHTELRVDKGIVNVSVHHPADNSLILIDLPGGQTDLLKDGFYTFNTQTNTVRVLVGEARAFTTGKAADSGTRKAKGTKVKEYQQYAFTGGTHSTDLDPMQAHSDVLPFSRPNTGERPGNYGSYGDGYYPAYYSYGSPYAYGGWDYPYGYYGYPFLGVGFGYGFYGGYGFRSGYYGGFHGRR